MDLAELNFKVNTKELLEAVDTLDKVATAIKGLNSANNSSSSTSSANSPVAQIVQQAPQAVTSTDKVSRALEKQSEKMKILRNETVTVADGMVQLGDGFTNSQAGMLANLKLMNATESQMKALAASFMEYNKITGVNTFDKSAAGLEKLRKQIAEIQSVNKLAGEGYKVTREQLILMSRDIERVTQAFQSNKEVMVNGKVYKDLDEAVKVLKSDFIGLATAVNVFEKEAKDAEIAAKKIASERANAEQAGMRMNEDAVALFIKNEQKKQTALQRTIRAQEESAIKQRLLNEGYTPSETSRIVTLGSKGVSEADAKAEIAVAREVAAARKQANEANKEAKRIDAERTAALKYVTEAEQHLNAELDKSNKLTTESTSRLVNYSNALKTAGVGASEAARRTAEFQTNLGRVDLLKKQRDVENLGRAMSTQMGDVAVSLASGMNPFMVMIQQGDQIRFAVSQSKLAAEDMSKAMRVGAAQIASSFLITGKIIGDFFLGSIVSAGKAINNLVTLGNFDAMMQSVSNNLQKFGTSASFAAKTANILSSGLNVLIGGLTTLGVSALLAFGVGLVQVIKEQDKLSTSLALTNGALGLSYDSAMQYAKAMNVAGVSTSKALTVITEMGKAGNLFSSDINMVTEAAYNLNKYGKVAIEDTVKTFSKLRDDPVKALQDIAKATGMVEPEITALVRSLVEQGRESEAAGIAMKAYADITSAQIDRMKSDYSSIGMFMIELGSTISKFFDDTFRAIFRKDTVKEGIKKQLDAVNDIIDNNAGVVGLIAQIPGIKKGYEEQRKQLQQQLVLLDKVDQSEQDRARTRTEAIETSIKAEKYRNKALTDTEKLLRDQIRLGQEYQQAGTDRDRESISKEMVYVSKQYNESLERRLKKQSQLSDAEKQHQKDLKIQNDLLAKSNDLNADFEEKFTAIFRLYKQTGDVEKYTKALNELASEQKYAKDEAAALKKEEQELARTMQELQGILDKELGFNKNYTKMLEQLDKVLMTTDMTVEEYTRLKGALDSIQPIFVKHRRAVEDINNSLKNSEAIIKSENEQLNMRSAMIGMTNEEQKQYTKEKERQKKISQAELDLEKALQQIRKDTVAGSSDRLSAEQEAYKQFGEKRKLIDREVAIAAAEEFREAFRKIEESLADSIVTALFEGGKEGRRKLRQLLIDELKKPVTAVINVFVKDLLSNLTNGLSGGSSSSSGLGTSGGQSNGSMIDTLVNAIGGSYESAIAKTYGSFAMSNTGQSLGLSAYGQDGSLLLTESGTMGASIASTAGYAAAGYGLYKGISGGYETNKLVDVVGKFAGLFGPYGVVVAAIAGAINRAFGKKLKDFGVQGTFGGESGFTGETFKDYKGGWLKSDSTETGGLDAEIQDLIGRQFKEVRASVVGFATQLGVDASKIVGYTKDIKFSTKDLDSDPAKAAEQIQAELQKEFEKSAEEMAKLVLEGTNLRKGQESYLDTLKRVGETVKVVNESLDALGLHMFDVSLAGTEAAVNFADLFGGLSQAQTALQSYYANFYKAEEKTQNVMQALTDQFNALGVDVAPKTKDAFRELVEQADAAGDTNLVATLIQMSSAFSQLMDELEPTQSVDYFIEKLRSQKRTNEEIAQSVIALSKETAELQVDFLRATGQLDAANQAAYALATEGMTEVEKAIFDVNEAMRHQIDIANERAGLENDLLRLTNNTVELRKRELAAIDPANRALKEFIYTIEDAQKLNDAIDQQLPKFLPRDEYRNLRFHQFGQKLLDEGILAGVAIDDLAERLSTMTRDEIYDAVVEVMNMSHMTDEMRLTLVETAGAIADFNDEIAEFEKTLRINHIQSSLDVINKEIGDFSVLTEPQLSISEQYVKNKELLSSILDYFGEKGSESVETIVGKLIEQAEALRNFRVGLKNQIEDARVKSMTKPERVSYLKHREQSLYAELQTTDDPVRVAQQIQDTILERLQEEADIRSELADKENEANDTRKKAIEDQISALERVRNLADEIHQFTSSLRFSDLSPKNYQDQLGEAKNLFDETLAKAKTGDENAVSNLIENARAYIEEARSYFASGTEYASIFNSVTGQLDALGVESVDPQLDTLYKQLDALETISQTQFDTEASVRQMNTEIVTQLGVLDEAVAAREEKTRDLLTEQKELLEAQVENQKAQIEQWAAIADRLIGELNTLNGTTAQTLGQIQLENAAPNYDSEGRRVN